MNPISDYENKDDDEDEGFTRLATIWKATDAAQQGRNSTAPSPPSYGGEGWGEEGRWLPLSWETGPLISQLDYQPICRQDASSTLRLAAKHRETETPPAAGREPTKCRRPSYFFSSFFSSVFSLSSFLAATFSSAPVEISRLGRAAFKFFAPSSVTFVCQT